jgi:hypothetical protein
VDTRLASLSNPRWRLAAGEPGRGWIGRRGDGLQASRRDGKVNRVAPCSGIRIPLAMCRVMTG